MRPGRDGVGRPRVPFSQKVKRMENKRCYLARKVKELKEELRSLKYGKQGN